MPPSKKKPEPKVKHPAPFSPEILAQVDRVLPSGSYVLDPFAGIGLIHQLRPRVKTIGIEIEPEWAAMSPFTFVGNALYLDDLFPAATFDAVATSVCYGNRMADSHDAKDESYRRTYKHVLGRDPHPDSAGTLQWGDGYRGFHFLAWRQAEWVLKDGGMLVLNVKDHVRDHEVQKVSAWHVRTLQNLGFYKVKHIKVPVRGFRQGENSEARVPYENVFVFIKARSHGPV